MRKLLIVLLVLFLPLQWSTAAVAAFCSHEGGSLKRAHLGHHTHNHADRDGTERSDHGTSKTCDASCSADHDHSHSPHALFAATHSLEVVPDRSGNRPYRSPLSEPPPDSLLRPPAYLLV